MRSISSAVTAVVTLVAPILAAAHQSAGAQTAAGGSARTVVLITIDTLRTDAVSFYGCEQTTTPNLDSLAEESSVFTRAYAHSWTVPAMASLFTSRHPSSHGVASGAVKPQENDSVWQQPMLPASMTTLPELFRSAGYRTIGVAANRHLQAGTGFERGFDHYFKPASFLTAPEVNHEVRKLLAAAFGADWRSARKNQKLFLWIHYFDPHLPNFPRQPWLGRYAPDLQESPDAYPPPLTKRGLMARYRPITSVIPQLRVQYLAEVSFLDHHLQRLLADLALGDDEVLLITADHGEEFADHGKLGHGLTLFEEVVRVPLLIRWPSRLAGGHSFDQTVTILDVYPTLAEAAGLAVGDGLQGQSLLPLIEDRDRYPGPAFLELLPPRPALQAVITSRWKLIRPLGNGSAEPMLFDLDRDPGEQRSLLGGKLEQQQLQLLHTQLRQWRAALPEPPPPRYFSSNDRELTEQLRALGYIE